MNIPGGSFVQALVVILILLAVLYLVGIRVQIG